jgi:copper chaperone NosL
MKKMSLTSRLVIAFASLSMTAVFFLPVWFIYLIAPQYPEGLEMNIWLNKITGQVDIINGLNHYIGMKHINADMFPEFGYMKYILAGFIAYGVLVAITGSRKLLFSLLVLTILMAGAALYDFYQWGYDYGHNLDAKAAIKVPGLTYQPPVIGHKQLLNFDAYSYPDVGGWIVIGAGSLFFLIYFMEWYRNRKRARAKASYTSKQTIAVAASIVVLLSSCTSGPEPFAYGKDLCEDCKMAIMEPGFGGEIITKKGRVYKFDDAHCLANYIKKDKVARADIKQTLFIDYNKEGSFADGTTAWFAVSEQLKSPMNSNAAAFATKEEADKKATETGGVTKNWDALLKAL